MRRAAILPIALLLLLLAPPQAATAVDCDPYDPLCQQIIDAKSQSADLQSQIDTVKRGLADAQNQVNAINAILLRLRTQRAAQEAQIAATQQQVDELARQVRMKQAEIDRAQARIAVREQYLGLRIRAMDKHGRVDYMQLVLTAKSFDQMVDRVMLMQSVVRGDQVLIDGLKTERQQMVALKAEISDKKAQLDAALAKMREQKAQLDITIGQQSQALALLQQLEAQLAQRQAELEQAKRQADAQVAELQKQYDQLAQGLGGGTGQFAWPLGGSRLITQPFGCTDLWGEPYDPRCPSKHTHTGIDMAGNGTGTPIVAADAGIATAYPGSSGYGNYVIIVHGNGYSTLYGHMSAFRIPANTPTRVLRGTAIGAEGSTGFSTGPHLHFEIRYNNSPANPCAWLGC